MNKVLFKKSIILMFFTVFVTVLVPLVASAVTPDDKNQDEVRARTSNVQQRVVDIKEKRESIKTKLEEKKLETCQRREKSINNIMSRIGDRGNKQLGVFTKIYENVKLFYDEKGNNLENYDSLVKDVDAAGANAKVSVEKVQNMSGTFKCGSEDPKGDSLIFKEYQNEQNDTLKLYKTAIKDLIVGVKSAQPQTGDQ